MNLDQRYRWIEKLWSTQRWDEWAQTTGPNYRFDPGVGPQRDLEATVMWSKALFRAFPNLNQYIEHLIISGGSAVGVTVVRGTMSNALDLGLGHVLPPTGRTFELPYVKVLDFDENGLVVRDRQYMDSAAMIAQLSG